ncbi:MAG: AAA family ATPase [Gammaproteobacteria bacterium]|nr:AAA family ATPase [Gammaproteobacteria bacterium]
MTFDLSFPTEAGQVNPLRLDVGETLFVLGANGTGKSSLMFRFNAQNYGQARKVSAHRQTWMQTDALDLTPSNKLQTEQNIRNQDQNDQSRYRDPFAAARASIAVFELVDAENRRARAMARAYDEGRMDDLASEAEAESPIAVINKLLRESHLPIGISIRDNEQVMASKNGGPEYGAAQLSDGERNVLLISAHVLTAPPGTLLLIDEPERHLHRSIIAPLLGALFERRKDCGFVISTHDAELALESSESRALLLRSCAFDGHAPTAWVADELGAGAPPDDGLKRDLLGSRRRILYVEGTERSLDKPLYSLVFPMVSVVPKGSCVEVEQAVAGLRAAEALHWLRAYGIVDGDGLDADRIAARRERGVYALPFYSAEAVYFHPIVIARVASRQSSVLGTDEDAMVSAATAAAIAAVRDHTARLSAKAAKKAVRRAVLESIPNDDDLLAGDDLHIENRAGEIQVRRKRELDAAVGRNDWEGVLRLCPVRESVALDRISTSLRFSRRADYLVAVRHLLAEDEDALSNVRALFGNLPAELLG